MGTAHLRLCPPCSRVAYALADGRAATRLNQAATFLLAGSSGWPTVLATLARVSLAVGLLWGPSLDKPTPARFVGALLTYVTGISLAVRLALG